MTDEKRAYIKAAAEIEWYVFGYGEKITFINVLSEMLANDKEVLPIEEKRNAQRLLERLQKEISNYT